MIDLRAAGTARCWFGCGGDRLRRSGGIRRKRTELIESQESSEADLLIPCSFLELVLFLSSASASFLVDYWKPSLSYSNFNNVQTGCIVKGRAQLGIGCGVDCLGACGIPVWDPLSSIALQTCANIACKSTCVRTLSGIDDHLTLPLQASDLAKYSSVK